MAAGHGSRNHSPVSTVTFIFATPLSFTLKLILLDPVPGRSEGRVQGQPVRSVLIEKGANGLWRMGSRRGAGTNDLDRELSG
jgi:hypothetical protein